MGALLERLLTTGGTAWATVELEGPEHKQLLVRNNPVQVTGYPGGTIVLVKGKRKASAPLARSGPIDYQMQWGPNTEPRAQDLRGIFDIVRAGSGYQVNWAFGGRLNNGQPMPEVTLTVTESEDDVYTGQGDNHFYFAATISLSPLSNVDNVLDQDEGLRRRLGG